MTIDANSDSIVAFVFVFAVLGVLFGVVLVCRGFASLRTRRYSESLPTSTVRAMALGPVELSGVIAPGLDVADPVYAAPCVYYSATVEHRILTFKDNSLGYEWVTIFHDRSGLRPFWFTDGTGTTLIWAPEADLRYTTYIEFTCGFFGSLFGTSDEVKFLRKVKKQRVFVRRVRLELQVLRPGTSLYILGYAVTPDAFKPANTPYTDALQVARSLSRGRVIVRGEGGFIVARSERAVTASRFGIFLQVAIGFALAAASLFIIEFFWVN